MNFDASMLNVIQGFAEDELKKGIVYEDPDINEELKEIVKICKDELKDHYGFAGAMGILFNVDQGIKENV